MALSLLQKGTGDALCVYAAPLPDASPGHPDTTTAPSIPGPTRAALGPGPCIVGVNARGSETPEEILAFAERATGRKLWWAVLVGASRGCSRVRDLWAAGAAALALVLGDGMHGSRPPDGYQIGFAQSVVALGRTGAVLAVVLHTYLDPGAAITSTVEMARRGTGWDLPPPSAGTTVVRVEEPTGGASADPTDWRGELVVISRASTPNDKVAHQDVLGRLLPLAIQRYVRPLVELADRPVVSASPPPERSPEPSAVLFPGATVPSPVPPDMASRAPGLKPLRQSEVTQEMGAWASTVLRDQSIPMGGSTTRAFDGRTVVARIETHPPSAQIPHAHRGATLYWPAAEVAPPADPPAPPVDRAASRPPPAPALVALLRQIDARWPSRARGADGIAPSAAHTKANPKSDHELLNALDVTHDPVRGPDLDALAKALLEDDRAKYVIWRRRIANPEIENGAWRSYTGTDPHTGHLHLSIDSAKRDHDEPWGLDAVGTADGEAPAKAPGIPKEIVVENLGPLSLEEYVARVVTAENGRSWEPQSLQALALAARTYAVYLMRAEGWGTAAKPMPNSTAKQVVAGAPTPLAAAAAQATRGGLVLWKHQPILAFHNAGAVWPKGALTGAGGRDESGTEQNITYNRGRRANQVRPSPIAKNPLAANRGCLSQHGADELGRQGYGWPEILRWFYGDDIEFSIAEPASRISSPVRPQPFPKPSPKPSPEEEDSSVLPFLAGAAGAAVLAKLFLG